jgi:hypothetical protein
MFLWKDFLKGQIRKIQNKERMEERKRGDFSIRGGSHTQVFS